tara:strand:+ start:2776 stop:3867 length:1092 start_codon:yes stop_codon:yes gene_type:complete
MRFGLILSLDYEVFGNGTGSVKKHIIEPTDYILEICDKYNFKLTIMFEACEYWSFKSAEEKGKLSHIDYSPSHLMELQIQKAIEFGHDVQLHLHPQWINSSFSDGSWNLDYKYWKISDLPYKDSERTGESLLSIFKKGKTTLESILKEVDSNYECLAFRAGSWCIQPEKDVIQALKETNFRIDSSVFKGGFSRGLSEYDYTKAPFPIGYWWTKGDKVCEIGDNISNIVESPIYTLNRPFYHNLKLSKLGSIIKSRFLSRKRKSIGSSKQVSLFSKAQNPFSLYPFKFDFCKLTLKEMKYFLDSAIKSNYPEGLDFIPIVAIGHSKDFRNNGAFEKFLEFASKKNNVESMTFQSLWNSIDSIEN